MEDLTQSDPNPDPHSGCRVRSRHGFLTGIVLGLLGAGLVGFAIGAATPAAEAAFGALTGHGRGKGPTAAEARDHAEFFVAFALHRLQASPEQEASVQASVGKAIDEAFPILDKHRSNREALHDLLGAESIDHAAIEKLRVQEVALVDELSRVLASTVAEGAETLTLAQRRQLLEHLERFRHRP